jgi:hypothetical protein
MITAAMAAAVIAPFSSFDVPALVCLSPGFSEGMAGTGGGNFAGNCGSATSVL